MPNPLDPDVKKALDVRLARGEITKDEYIDLLNTLSGETPGAVQEAADPQQPSRYEPPIIVVDDDLVLFKDHLKYKGKAVGYQHVISLSYYAESKSINFVPMSHIAVFSIEFAEGHEPISYSSNTYILKSKIMARLQQAYAWLSERTLIPRLQNVVRKLCIGGCIDLPAHPKTKLYKNGDIEVDGKIANVKLAAAQGWISIGTEFVLGGSRASNPYQVLIGITGTGLFSKKLLFHLSKN